jgi:hypothetical protein
VVNIGRRLKASSVGGKVGRVGNGRFKNHSVQV